MTVLVTGATGTVGRQVVQRLVAEGARVRAVSRSPRDAALPYGVEVVQGDPARPGTMAGHFTGVETVFLHPRTFGDSADRLLALAAERGVRRVVALSAMNIDDPFDLQPSRWRGDRNKESEEAAVACGLAWTSLRASSFAGNTLQAWGAQIRAGDVVRYVHAGFRESLLDERDLADVAARALLTDELLTGELAGRRLELTGPESLSHEETVAVIGAALGRPLRFEEVPSRAVAAHLIGNGLPEPFVRTLMARYDHYAGHEQHPATAEVEKVLGRPARTYSEWVTDHVSAFRNG
ncbi:NAD(P)H-binding protein [Microbispora hainanensis]|uniref:NAD-dependent epimerase/dehydratase family protein n=1 Tax=Microbispora hainanensis TaxID=568844 RepID=A0A544XXH2_9ACTN|nr:NAD(P)H-binding protein [Microbispora hainanensis]TQS09210.1 NAD-dependent epimerase/dehydratase family protein [Microbispora hainanensis]